MELWTGELFWSKCHWPDLKSAGVFRRNLFLNSLKNFIIVTLTLTLWPINSGVLTFLLLSHLSSSFTDSVPSLNLLCHSKTDARFMQDAPKAVWSIPYVSVAFFLSLKQNFIAYSSSNVSDCIFEIQQLWQSDFSRVYSNCCCSCSFEPEIIKIGQSSHEMYSNNILNFQESTPSLNAHTKKVWKLIVCTSYHWKRYESAVSCCSSTRLDLALNIPQRLMYHQNKETKQEVKKIIMILIIIMTMPTNGICTTQNLS